MNPPQVYSVPHPEPFTLLPSHTIPLGHPSAPAPSNKYHALNLDWQFISYMILHIFQCHSPKSFHPLRDCSICRYRFGVSVGGESRVFLCRHLGWAPLTLVS